MPLPDFVVDCETPNQFQDALAILDNLSVMWYGDHTLPSSYVPSGGRYLFIEDGMLTYMGADDECADYFEGYTGHKMSFSEFMEVYGGASKPHIEFDAKEFEDMLSLA